MYNDLFATPKFELRHKIMIFEYSKVEKFIYEVFLPFSGGLSNLLYYISLPNSLLENEKTEADPHEVLIRVYGQTHGEHALEALITESVIFTLLSERGLGPKLHGIFPGGRIEQYVNARPLKTKELSDEHLSVNIAQKMAAIHCMEVSCRVPVEVFTFSLIFEDLYVMC